VAATSSKTGGDNNFYWGKNANELLKSTMWEKKTRPNGWLFYGLKATKRWPLGEYSVLFRLIAVKTVC